MPSELMKIFEDEYLAAKIKKRLPYLFYLAELESSRAGIQGMEVGSLREKIIIALLIYKFGEENVETNIPITEPEVDVKLFSQFVSIKTISSKGFGGVKISWTVDAAKAREFRETYYPHFDILLVRINWGGTGGFYYLPIEAQKRVFDTIGKDKYIKLPKPGTNPRGAEITKEALSMLVEEETSRFLEIYWQRPQIEYNPYKRWIDYWRED